MAYHFFKPKTMTAPPLLPTPATEPSRQSRRDSGVNSKITDFMSSSNAYKPFDSSLQFRPPLTTTPSSSFAKQLTHEGAYRNASPESKDAGLTPYPDLLRSSPTPHPHVTVDPIHTAHVPALMRTTGLLLPVRYPNSFYTATITDPMVASVSRVAVYHEQDATKPSPSSPSSVSSSDKVIGAIRSRVEFDTSPYAHPPGSKILYIQALHLLSPYRGNGIATSLFESLIYAPDPTYSSQSQRQTKETQRRRRLSAIVKHYNIRTVSAHVHETNDEALAWYAARGFSVQSDVIEGYYRRLKPGGAKIVTLRLDWEGEDDEAAGLTVSGTKSSATKTGPDASVRPQDDDDADDDWEKIEMDECSPPKQAGDYDAVDKKPDVDEGSRKRIKSR